MLVYRLHACRCMAQYDFIRTVYGHYYTPINCINLFFIKSPHTKVL